MGVADIANVPNDQKTLLEWSFSHMAHHRDINRRIFEIENVALPEYALDPVNPNDAEVFLAQHQIMHNNQNTVLGIEGQNLSEVNFRDPVELSTWIFLNFQEHLAAYNILGV